MLCLGFSGGLNRVHENPFDLPLAFTHDGAAVLVADGRVVAAAEEERFNRIKHSNKFPADSIRFCLEAAGARLADVDRIAFYATERYCDALLDELYAGRSDVTQRPKAPAVLRELLRQELGAAVDPARITFARHHLAHAVSAHAMSGFDESLVLAIDGYGDGLSGIVALARGDAVTAVEHFPQRDSLGVFYLEVIHLIGYAEFDEYKVMGLAPYGDPATYRELLAQFYALLPQGGYRVDSERVERALRERIAVRAKGEPFTDQHRDLAAALQEALERIVFHVLRHRRRHLGMRNLCLAGGVALNSTMNGKILASGLFDDVFVQPAAHDAGCALGAALMASHELGRPAPRERLAHVYWGRALGDDADVERELAAWSAFIECERSDDVARDAAALIAAGEVIGWVQGRSEFGPRALGNRSILADPRPAANKARINRMVKKREAYRPFAPSVLEADAREYFELPPHATSLPFMIFVVGVRPDKRALLGAVTHVDGTARVQTVARDANPAFWSLINAFKELTGVPVVLNTSFNNNAEPIVDSLRDAVVCFLTTGLDRLVAGPFIARKRAPAPADWRSLSVALPPYAQVRGGEIRTTYGAPATAISGELSTLLAGAGTDATVGELLAASAIPPGRWDALADELRALWAARLVVLAPTRAPR
jgi:carbamoyltransferase